MRKGQDQHVIRSGREWAVRGAGDEKSSAYFPVQFEAIDYAKKIARKLGSDVKIHGQDGVIRDAKNYGVNPFPPREKSE